MATIDELEKMFDEHPSLDASLQDFEHPQESPRFGYPSHHSGFRSSTESLLASSGGGYSPPAWRREGTGRSSGFWNSGSGLRGEQSAISRRGVSRESSAEYESADEGGDATLDAARRTRLPTGSVSPEKRRSPSPDAFAPGKKEPKVKLEESDMFLPNGVTGNNYIRFALRAELQHRVDPYEDTIRQMKDIFSLRAIASYLTIAIISFLTLRTLFQQGPEAPVPDLVKVAGLAKSFEPLIFYSENGARQIGDLQATGVAVWDLGESVRSTNMTSAPIIVKELDDLSESLKTLAMELTRFFANVDGDVDAILLVMQWATRELTQLTTNPPSHIARSFDMLHNALARLGLLSPSLDSFTTSLFGLTTPQRTRATLQRTFTEFLSVLEDAINTELQHSLALFALFEAIDRQFLNLARTVIREADAQDAAQDDLLSSLWVKILGPDASTLHKFETNKQLLGNIRRKTVANKSVLLEHNGKLIALKANLESLRRKLVSPLLRGNGSTLGVEDQIRGLVEVGGYLGAVREKQRGRLMEVLYGAGRKDGERKREIDGGR